jgi:hypothetical protein
MWRRFSITVFLFVLATTANALPIENFTDNFSAISKTYQLEKNNSQTSIAHTVIVDESEPEDAFSLPRLSRACASVFSNEVQTTPNYMLVIEFFEIKMSTGLFKNLANPPVHLNWYEQLSHRSNSTRLSGWKDGNILYASRLTYHS